MTGPDVWLAIEISSRVDRADVERAHRGAALLRRSGLKVVAAVAGKALTEGARSEARRQAVAVFEDGRAENWDDALAADLSASGKQPGGTGFERAQSKQDVLRLDDLRAEAYGLDARSSQRGQSVVRVALEHGSEYSARRSTPRDAWRCS